MSDTTPNLSLIRWNTTTDPYSATELNANWDAIDAVPDNIRKIKILSALPDGITEPRYPGRLAICTTVQNGVPPYTLMRYDGTNWHVVGPIEQLSAVPTTGLVSGRLVLLTSFSSGFSPYTLIVCTPSGWIAVGTNSLKSVRISAASIQYIGTFVSGIGTIRLNAESADWDTSNFFGGGSLLQLTSSELAGLYLIEGYLELFPLFATGIGNAQATLYRENPDTGTYGELATVSVGLASSPVSVSTKLSVSAVYPLVLADQIRMLAGQNCANGVSMEVRNFHLSLTRLGSFNA